MATAFGRLVSASLHTWVGAAKACAAKVESGAYTPPDWIADTANYTAGMCAVWYECVEALVTGRIVEIVESDPFSISRAGPGARSLQLAGGLQAAMSAKEVIERTRIRVLPAQLQGTDRSFRLQVDATGCRGDAYQGIVNVMDGARLEEQVAVVVLVP
jgi:hypothetical protein